MHPRIRHVTNGNTSSGPSHHHNDDDGIAFAAQAAANAFSERDEAVAAQQDGPNDTSGIRRPTNERLVCRVCGKSAQEDGRPMVRFLPVELDLEAAHAAPSVVTFSQDITLHVFCGKTASILPTVNRPDLEILTKAGLKNKHGIGAEINTALARTRTAVLKQDGAKAKHFFFVREFEAHLAAIRNTSITFASPAPSPLVHSSLSDLHHQSSLVQQQSPVYDISHHHVLSHLEASSSLHSSHDDGSPDASNQGLPRQHHKQLPVRASAGRIEKPGKQRNSGSSTTFRGTNGFGLGLTTDGNDLDGDDHVDSEGAYGRPAIPFGSALTEDGKKIRCSCGGTHLPPGTPKGAQSWRNHVTTRRHQKWMEDNGLLGSV